MATLPHKVRSLIAHCPRAAYAAVAISLLSSSACHAALQPDEIALIVPRGNRESIALAKYYCRQRNVPEKHICEADLVPGEVLEREKWNWAVRPEIKEWLDKNDPERKLRCLITTWGVPLKIGPAKQDATSKAYLKHLEGERSSRIEQLEKVVGLLDSLAGGSSLPDQPATAQPNADNADNAEDKPANKSSAIAKLQQRLEKALSMAQKRIASMPPGDERRATEARLQQLATAAGGARVMLQGMNQQIVAASAAGKQPLPQLQRQFDILRGRSSAFSELKLMLDQHSPGYQRDFTSLTMLQQTGGLLAAVEWLDEQIATARKNETGSSFDSELSLVLWQNEYQLLRWQPNYLRPSFDGSQFQKTFPTLMVARLDASSLKLAKGLIDSAIAVEKAGGLKGKVYLDARGLAKRDGPKYQPGSYPDYDHSLLITADGMRSLKNSEDEPRFEVKLDEQAQLFHPGQCPDAALYCGWYSLAKYVDAFDWNQGAIAYHLASAEATTLKEPDSQVWCKKLIEDGVAATIGPVYEPYLLAYPRPNEFMALLVQGDLPLVEVYYRTKAFNSWMMVLIGDPLYRPYKT